MDDLEIQLLYTQSQLKDVLQPNLLLAELSQLILQMLIEYTEYISKNKETERNRASKRRLLRLLDISTDLNGLGDLAVSLRLQNKRLCGYADMKDKKIKELEDEIARYTKSFKDL